MTIENSSFFIRRTRLTLRGENFEHFWLGGREKTKIRMKETHRPRVAFYSPRRAKAKQSTGNNNYVCNNFNNYNEYI